MSEPFNYEFNYSLTEKDVESFLIYHAKSPYNRPRLIVMGVAPLLLAIIAYIFSGEFYYFYGAIFIYFLMIISLPFSIMIVKLLIKRRIKKNPTQYLIDVDQTLVLNNDNIVNQTQLKKISLSWNDIEYVLFTKDNVYLYNNSRSTIPVPGRLFKDNVEFNAFIQKVKEAHAAARKNPGGVA